MCSSKIKIIRIKEKKIKEKPPPDYSNKYEIVYEFSRYSTKPQKIEEKPLKRVQIMFLLTFILLVSLTLFLPVFFLHEMCTVEANKISLEQKGGKLVIKTKKWSPLASPVIYRVIRAYPSWCNESFSEIRQIPIPMSEGEYTIKVEVEIVYLGIFRAKSARIFILNMESKVEG